MVMPHNSTRVADLDVASILRADQLRWRLLEVVRALSLPDCWIGAGFVRNAVWAHLHERQASALTGNVDIIWFHERTDPSEDRTYEAILYDLEPSITWSVKNQAHTHKRNDDKTYTSAVDAMRFWPETSTAIAARRDEFNNCEIAAPFGLNDLFNLILRPAPRFSQEKFRIYEERHRQKGWAETWPRLRIVR